MPIVTDEDAALQATSSLDSLSAAQQAAKSHIDRLLHADDDNPFVDIHELFPLYDVLYFRGRLSGQVEVSWSKRLTLCAGICELLKDDHGKYKPIRLKLSEALLKYRPREDTINTLLHDHHAFHAEVDAYRTHVWQCSGTCRQKPPYFGLVKRTMNRPPGKSDAWFARHEEECGGTWTKIAEPEPKLSPQKTGKTNQTGKQKNNLDGWIKQEKKDASPLTTAEPQTTPSTPSPATKRPHDPTTNDSDPKPTSDKKLIIECPICTKLMSENCINEHLDLEHPP